MMRSANLSPARLNHFRRLLLAWYSREKRDLPWRRTRDPYRIWISEIMLQQTRVAAVLGRYEEFLTRFPTIDSLATATEPSVLAAWSGLGYYRRARNLHAAAKKIVQHHGGTLPRTSASWRKLPGVGRYTAAAIASIAFAEPVAVLDGNVKRVLHRLLGNVHTQADSWSAAQRLLDPSRPGDFNQAMMELGATVCLPQHPQCSHCPIRRFCRTQGPGSLLRAKPRQRKRAVTYCLQTRADSIRMVRRPAHANLMPGMWELPQVVSPRSREVLFSVSHSITTSRLTVTVVSGRAQGRWVRVSRMETLPLTGLARKILRVARIMQ
jgi:A/G-specific adenine glycosylase